LVEPDSRARLASRMSSSMSTLDSAGTSRSPYRGATTGSLASESSLAAVLCTSHDRRNDRPTRSGRSLSRGQRHVHGPDFGGADAATLTPSDAAHCYEYCDEVAETDNCHRQRLSPTGAPHVTVPGRVNLRWRTERRPLLLALPVSVLLTV
jgi:hypothetical protein